MLVDRDKDIVYIPVSGDFFSELDDWSLPVQMKIENGELVCRRIDMVELLEPMIGGGAVGRFKAYGIGMARELLTRADIRRLESLSQL